MKRKEAMAALIAAAMIVLALMTVFALELADDQADSVSDVQNRVRERSMLAADLIDSLFQTSSLSSQAQAARLYGTPTVSSALLDRVRGRYRYVVVLDSSGRLLAYSQGFTAQARAGLASSAALELLRAGHPWALGNVLPYGRGGVINYGLALPTAAGTRYLLTGFEPATMGPFLEGELRQIPGVAGAHNYVLDGHGVVLSSTNPQRPTGYVFHTPAQLSVLRHTSSNVRGQYFDQVPLTNTSWRILLTAPDSQLFASVSGARKWAPWLVFGAFAIFAFAALVLALRWLRASEQAIEAGDRLADANLQLEGTNRELARSNAELEQYASIASHDLQEPLRKVRTFTERVRETEADRLTERGRDDLTRAATSAERMQTLIEDLLRYSRVSTHGRPFAPVNLDEVTAEVLDDLEETIRRAGAVIAVGELPTINADRTQMHQLLQNLVSNAVKFKRDEVRLEVEIEAAVSPGWVTLEVRDNGIGFDPQYAQRIFRVFERLHGRGAYPGTGIGLALCLKIAERHGGTVTARSASGRGAVFTVRLQTGRKEAVSDVPPLSGTDVPGDREESYVGV